MSIANVVENTGNQSHITFDVSKVFVFNNRYKQAIFLNNTGAEASFLPGTLVGRVSASGKIVLHDSAAVDGSEIPVGVLKTNIIDLADAAEIPVADFAISGDVVKDKIVLTAGDSFDDVIDGRRLIDRIGGDTVGIILVDSIELTAFDNS